MAKIYVGNLPFSATEDSVRALFAQHGTVESVALINDRETGRPRGFGFVEMPRADAQRAIQSLNGQDMGGRPLKVNEAQDKPRGGGGGGVLNGTTAAHVTERSCAAIKSPTCSRSPSRSI
jgi:RNA recognition motif-containing protein